MVNDLVPVVVVSPSLTSQLCVMQALPSSHEMAGWPQLPSWLQTSSVQALPSLQSAGSPQPLVTSMPFGSAVQVVLAAAVVDLRDHHAVDLPGHHEVLQVWW